MQRQSYDDIEVFERLAGRRFWSYSFVLYAMAEALYIIAEYNITFSMCENCVLPVAFYILYWMAAMLFIFVLWYCLGKIYHYKLWKASLLNICIFLISIASWGIYKYIVFNYGPDWLIGSTVKNPTSFGALMYETWGDIGMYVFRLSVFYALKFYYENSKTKRKHVQLILINRELQLNAVKQQLNPHFYFNTLNNLYGLARENDSKLPMALDQLGNIMRYLIVDCSDRKVLLSREVNFLHNYLALQKLRYEAEEAFIEMHIKGHPGEQKIIPLLLVQFVENAFKHGMKDTWGNNWIRINMEINKNEIQYIVRNSCQAASYNEGLGIASVRKLLYLEYGDRYEMTTRSHQNIFSVRLKLNLHEARHPGLFET